jgi:hypothetical protein
VQQLTERLGGGWGRGAQSTEQRRRLGQERAVNRADSWWWLGQGAVAERKAWRRGGEEEGVAAWRRRRRGGVAETKARCRRGEESVAAPWPREVKVDQMILEDTAASFLLFQVYFLEDAL